MDKPVASIIVPALNSGKTIKKCILSLIRQTYPRHKYEIIIVDNDSKDDTLRILKKFKKDIRIYQEKDCGSYKARNLGIRKSKGNILLFTDSDCVAKRTWVSCTISALKGKKVGLVGGPIKAYRTNKKILKYCDEFCHTQKEYSEKNVLAASNMAAKKKVFIRVGLFNENLKSSGDFEFCSRATKLKIKVSYNEKAKIYHIYDNSLIKFIKNNFRYGLWNGILKKIDGKHYYIPKKSYIEVFQKHGLGFIFFRILQDFSFRLGISISYLPMIKSRLISGLP